MDSYEVARKKLLSRFRSRKRRLLNADTEKDGFSGVSPLSNVRDELRSLEIEKQKALLELQIKYDKIPKVTIETPEQTREFLEYERKLTVECSGDSDLLYRKYGYPNGKPNKEYVYVDKGVCPKCGRMLKNCICKDNEKKSSLEWLKM